MTAFRYCVWLWWNERERGWSSAAPAGVWVWISHIHARRGWCVLISTGGECAGNGKKWNQARALLIWRSETWNLWSRSAATIQLLLKHDLETRVPLLLVAFLCSATTKTAFLVRKYQVWRNGETAYSHTIATHKNYRELFFGILPKGYFKQIITVWYFLQIHYLNIAVFWQWFTNHQVAVSVQKRSKISIPPFHRTSCG